MNLPQPLQHEATQLAQQRGMSLDDFILWAVTEKVDALKHQRDFPEIAWTVGASGLPTPVIGGTQIRVQTVAIAHTHWQLSLSAIAHEYDLSETQVQQALTFYQTHRAEIDATIAIEETLESTYA